MSKFRVIAASAIGVALLWFLFPRTREEIEGLDPNKPVTGMDYALSVIRFGFAIDLEFNIAGIIEFQYPGTPLYTVQVYRLPEEHITEDSEFVVSVGNGGRCRTRRSNITKDQLLSICAIIDGLADALHNAGPHYKGMHPSRIRFLEKTNAEDQGEFVLQCSSK